MLYKLGMSGPEILNIERAIDSMGFAGIVMDGEFDIKLENVVRYIQKSHNLVVDGEIGPKTLALLDSLYQPQITNFGTSVPVAVLTPSVTDAKGIHPILKRKVDQIIAMAASEGFTVKISQGLRSFLEQHKLFKQRPKVTNADQGQSYHNYGVAADLVFIVDGKVSWDEKLYKNIGLWANQVGLTWGGNWKFVDYPHLQLAGMPSVKAMLAVYKQNPSNPVQAVWNKFVGG